MPVCCFFATSQLEQKYAPAVLPPYGTPRYAGNTHRGKRTSNYGFGSRNETVHTWDGKPLSKFKRSDGDNQGCQKDANVPGYGHLKIPFLNNVWQCTTSTEGDSEKTEIALAIAAPTMAEHDVHERAACTYLASL